MKEINKKNEDSEKAILQTMKIAENSFLDRTGRVIVVSMIIGFGMLGQVPQAVANEQTDDQLTTSVLQEANIAPANLLCLGLADLTICETFTICGSFCLFNNNPA